MYDGKRYLTSLLPYDFLFVIFFVLQVRLITDKVTGKPKGYAFIEYMHKRDMKGLFQLISMLTTFLLVKFLLLKLINPLTSIWNYSAAYKQADGRKIDGRRVLVDVERGRTVPNWRPRRLGGGLGTTRVGGEENSQRHSGR